MCNTDSIKLHCQMHACERVRLIVFDRWPLNWPLKKFFVNVRYVPCVVLFSSCVLNLLLLFFAIFTRWCQPVSGELPANVPIQVKWNNRFLAVSLLLATAHAIPQITCGVNSAKVPFVMHR